MGRSSSLEDEVVACVVTWIGAVNGLDCGSVEVPVPDSDCYCLQNNTYFSSQFFFLSQRNSAVYMMVVEDEAYLLPDNGRIISKPSVVPLGLAVCKTRIYEEPVFARSCKVFYGIQHLISEAWYQYERRRSH